MDDQALEAVIRACRALIESRFEDRDHRGTAARSLADGTILTGTSPDAINPSVQVCHEIEPYCGAITLVSRSWPRSACTGIRMAAS